MRTSSQALLALAVLLLSGCREGAPDRHGQAQGRHGERQKHSGQEELGQGSQHSGQEELGGQGPHGRGPVSVASLPAVMPIWTARPPDEPGLRVLDRSEGPIAAGDAAIVASSAVGVVAVELRDGRVRWQRRGESAPELPVVAANGASVWLTGTCAAQAARAPGDAVACMEEVDMRSGELLGLAWIPRAAFAEGSGRRRVLGGWVRPHGGDIDIIWAHGPSLISMNPRQPHQTWTRYEAPQQLELDICGWLAEHDRLFVATCDGIAQYARGQHTGESIAADWHIYTKRAAGVAGPVRVGRLAVRAHGDDLIAMQGGREAWRAKGIHAYAPGSIASMGGARTMLAVRIDGGIRPVVLSAATGEILAQWPTSPGIQVLAATMHDAGLALAVRLDSSLRHDAVISYGQDGQIRWAWPIPAPVRRRIERLGLAAAGPCIVVFHDGRQVACLPR